MPGRHEAVSPEYVALTILQADALITLDAELERAVRGIVETAPLEAIL